MTEKDKILEWFENALTKHCDECGHELPRYPMYSEKYEIYRCENCGKEYRKERVALQIKRRGSNNA